MRKTPALALAAALLLPLGLAACQNGSPVTVETDDPSTSSSEGGSDSTREGSDESGGEETQASDDGEKVSVFDIKAGDCFNSSASASSDAEVVNSVELVSCDAPHDAEVYAEGEITGHDSYPGDATIQDEATTICSDGFEPYVGTGYDSSSYSVTWLSPSEDSWNNIVAADRTVSCLLISGDGGQLTGSGQDSGK